MRITRNDKTPIMHRSVVHNGTAHLSGVVAEDFSGDMEHQMRQAVRQLDAVLAAAGTDKSRLLAATLYITDMSQKPAMNKVWSEWLGEDDLPARATIGVADLGENVLVEIVVTAATG